MTILHGIKALLLTILFICLATSVSGADNKLWTTEDYTLEAAYLVLHSIDWLQTREIATNDKFYEAANQVMLSKYPTLQEVDIYFALSGIGHILVSHFLPKKGIFSRNNWQALTIGISASCVSLNFQIGVRF